MNQNIVLAQHGNVYSDYESAAASVNWCTPELLRCSICANVSASGGTVTLQLTLKTPIGSYSRTFHFNSNICVSWNLPVPLSPSVNICIKNLNIGSTVSFSLNLDFCATFPWPIGKRCASWSHNFTIPTLLEATARPQSIGSDDLAMLCLLLADTAGESEQPCKCH